VSVVAVGDDGHVEMRYTINPDDRERKLDILRNATADAYERIYKGRPRRINVSDWPLLGGEIGKAAGEQPVHGVENATFAFPEEHDHV
jgi:transposase